MKITLLLVTGLAAVAAAVPVAATADPAGAVKADLTQLQADITKAHDTLLADIAKISSDAGKGNPATVKADIQAFRSDRETLVGAVKADIAQLKTDIQAATAQPVPGVSPGPRRGPSSALPRGFA